MTLVLGVRCGYLADDTVELLCLRRGDGPTYRLFLSTVDLSCHERSDDLEGVDFDIADAGEVETFLIESLWRLHLAPIELQLVCSSFEVATRGLDESVATTLDRCCQASNLLTLFERQLLFCRGSPLEPFMMNLMEQVAATIERLPYLSNSDKARLTALRHRVILELSVFDRDD